MARVTLSDRTAALRDLTGTCPDMRTTPHRVGRGRSQLASMRLLPSHERGSLAGPCGRVSAPSSPRPPLGGSRGARSMGRQLTMEPSGGAAGSRTRVPRPQEVRLYVRRSRMSRMRYSRTRQWSASTPSEGVPIGSMVEADRWIPMSSLWSPYRASGAERHGVLGRESQTVVLGIYWFRRVITEVPRRPPARSSPPGTDHGRDRFSPGWVEAGCAPRGAHRRCPVVNRRWESGGPRLPRVPLFGTAAPAGSMVTRWVSSMFPKRERTATPA